MRTALLLLSALALSCGSGGGGGTGGGAGGGGGATARCNTSNCAGCCDSSDVCQLGQSSTACGTGGNACLACGTGLACSSGVCVASGAGGGGGTGTGGGGGGSTGPKRLFITRTEYSGDLKSAGGGATGLQGGDNLCNTAAAAANIGGTWVAWLSAGTVRAYDRVQGTGPWQLVGSGTTIFNNRAALATTPLAAIDRDETGSSRSAYAWTGTSTGGGPSGNDCQDWTGGGYGTLGNPEQTGAWTTYDYRTCSNTYSLLCFEQ